MEDEVVSPFLDWDEEAVCLWLSSLDLSSDYSMVFRGKLSDERFAYHKVSS